MDPSLQVLTHLRQSSGDVHVSVFGELDLAARGRLVETIGPFVRNAGRVHIDLRGLDFLDSTGVEEIVEAVRLASDAGLAVTVDVSAAHRRVFGLMAVDGPFRWGPEPAPDGAR